MEYDECLRESKADDGNEEVIDCDSHHYNEQEVEDHSKRSRASAARVAIFVPIRERSDLGGEIGVTPRPH